MSTKDILVVTLSSDEEDSKEENRSPTALHLHPSPPPKRITRQSARKRSARVAKPKVASDDDSASSDENGHSDSDNSGSDEDYTPSYENVPPNCDNDLPILPEKLIDRNSRGQMFCPICKAIFKKKTDFILHRRRHVAPDHFMCTTCHIGFLKLRDCLDHEFELHHNQNMEGSNGVQSSDQGKLQTGGKHGNAIIPSTCLYAYRGPPIKDMYEPYEIDYKYTRPEKKMNTRNTSRHILDWHLSIKENTEALIEEARQNQESQGSEKEKVIISRSTSRRSAYSLSSGDKTSSPRARDHSSNRNVEPRLTTHGKYQCKECGYASRKRHNVEAHIDDKHPSIPDDRIEDFILAVESSAEEPSTEPSRHSLLASASGSRRESRPDVQTRIGNISRSLYTSPPKESSSKSKKKKNKKITFSKRLDGIRMWEKTKEPLTQAEFLSALSLINNSDVLLGPRQGLRRIESSLFCFRRVHREKSPPPHAKIVLEKLPIENALHNHVYMCNRCDFIAPTEKDIRNHRRNEHLKKDNATEDENGSPPSRNSSPPKAITKEDRVAIAAIPSSSDLRGEARSSESDPPDEPIPAGSKATKEDRVDTVTLPSTSDLLGEARSSESDPADDPAPTESSSVNIEEDVPPGEKTNLPLYKCNRCEFKSHDRRLVKAHRRAEHPKGPGSESGSESSPSSATSSATKVTPPPASTTSTVIVEEIEYQCDKCSFASCVKEEVKQHRKMAHPKKGGKATTGPPNTNAVPPNTNTNINTNGSESTNSAAEPRLNNFAKPTGPPIKKFKANNNDKQNESS